MEKCSGIDAVHNFWEQVWQSPQNYDAIDNLVVEDLRHHFRGPQDRRPRGIQEVGRGLQRDHREL